MDLDNLYQELIIDHGTSPRNFHALDNPKAQAEGYNPLCGDKVHIYLHIEDEVITDISFTGQGCAISMASASIMSEQLKGKNLNEAQRVFNNFLQLVTTEHSKQEELGKLEALAGVRKFPTRVKCATLAWHTLQQAIKENVDE